MKLELNENEIINAVTNDNPDNAEFLFNMIAHTTTKWSTVNEVLVKLLNYVNELGTIHSNSLDKINEIAIYRNSLN